MEPIAPVNDDSRTLRWSIYALLIAISLGSMAARLMQVRSASLKDPSPFLSANDRSRWCTVRSLVDHGTYAIDDVIFDAEGNRQRAWHTIDLVKHRGPDGKEHYYSSKPTLLPTMLAGEYWLLKQVTGTTFADKYKAFYLARIMLLLSQVLPLAGAMWLLTYLVERLGHSTWGRIFVVACATQATFLSTFAITLNNHVIAAVAIVISLVVLWPIWNDEKASWWNYALGGLASAFAVTCELPALAYFGLVGLAVLWKSPLKTFAAFVPAAAVVFAAALGTNYLAHQSLRPAYAHRNQDGPVMLSVAPHLARAFDDGQLPPVVSSELKSKAIDLSSQTIIEPRVKGERWVIWDVDGHDRLAVQLVDNTSLEVRAWDDWYDYEGTYWTADRLQGVDKGEQSVAVYALHVLIGHHGLFSLTPVWLLSVCGLYLWLRAERTVLWWFAAAVSLLTVVVLAFYLTRPLIDRNYGGVTSGLRWLFWLIPLWLLAMIPAADEIAKSRLGRNVAVAMFLVSVFSANYATLNPWSQPWLFEYWQHLGWINYE
ncbi:hypothetical protein NA78x_000174 [Anatilimnocola sp. NA78]|uniref:hypothetical protein n=1 Tax=Anatilimnocola sp. NA78 TaxID=3415683 RepID=UPI003CE504F3